MLPEAGANRPNGALIKKRVMGPASKEYKIKDFLETATDICGEFSYKK